MDSHVLKTLVIEKQLHYKSEKIYILSALFNYGIDMCMIKY